MPNGNFVVWEKLDGSLGIVCSYGGQRIVSTRGSFESSQASWFRSWLNKYHSNFTPSGETYLFEIIYPANRIVVDYGRRTEGVLLSILGPDAVDLAQVFDSCTRFTKAKRFNGLKDFDNINSDQFAGQEGFVVQWPCGFRAKVKIDEYKRLHRLITSCSTRTIWDLLRVGKGVSEITERVPAEFAEWVNHQVMLLKSAFSGIVNNTIAEFSRHEPSDRKSFATWALQQKNPPLMFALLDGKDITDQIWKLVEPIWATPFGGG